jgi:hypothetical protein
MSDRLDEIRSPGRVVVGDRDLRVVRSDDWEWLIAEVERLREEATRREVVLAMWIESDRHHAATIKRVRDLPVHYETGIYVRPADGSGPWPVDYLSAVGYVTKVDLDAALDGETDE